MIAYHVTERSRLSSILREGLVPRLGQVAGEIYSVKGIWLSKYPEHMFGWEDFEDPVILEVDVPTSYVQYEDEAGMEVYPEAEPFYVRRRVSSGRVRLLGSLELFLKSKQKHNLP